MTSPDKIRRTNAYNKIKFCFDNGIISSADIMKETTYSYELVIKTLNVIINDQAAREQAQAEYEYKKQLEIAEPEDFSKPSGSSFDQLLMFSESDPLVIRHSHPNHKS